MTTKENEGAEFTLDAFPLSERIAKGVERMTHAVTCMRAVGEARCGVADESLVRKQPDIHLCDPDPDQMARLKVSRTRDVARPVELEDQLEVKTPQFFLRHTHRMERFADDRWLEYTYTAVRDRGHLDDLRAVHQCTFERWSTGIEYSSMRVTQYLADKHALMVETPWRELFGRPDPVYED
jgi:hypothetical protein